MSTRDAREDHPRTDSATTARSSPTGQSRPEPSAARDEPPLELYDFYSEDDVDGTLRVARFPNPLQTAARVLATTALTEGDEVRSRQGRIDVPLMPPVRRLLLSRLLAVVFAVVAVIEAIFLARALIAPAPTLPAQPATAMAVPITIDSLVPGDVVTVDDRPVGVTPLKLDVSASMHSISIQRRDPDPSVVTESKPVTITAAAQTQKTRPAPPAAAPTRAGQLRLTSLLPLQILENGRVIGSSTGPDPIEVAVGVHQLEFVNTTVGYRHQQMVVVQPGEITVVPVTMPEGSVSINAQPWAQVWIDGQLIGETPIANLAVTLGEHEILYRHPQFGEKRERTLVRAGAPLRLSARFP
jgi:hypothetical protein